MYGCCLIYSLPILSGRLETILLHRILCGLVQTMSERLHHAKHLYLTIGRKPNAQDNFAFHVCGSSLRCVYRLRAKRHRHRLEIVLGLLLYWHGLSNFGPEAACANHSSPARLALTANHSV